MGSNCTNYLVIMWLNCFRVGRNRNHLYSIEGDKMGLLYFDPYALALLNGMYRCEGEESKNVDELLDVDYYRLQHRLGGLRADKWVGCYLTKEKGGNDAV